VSMLGPNLLKKKLASGQRTLGSFLLTRSADNAEVSAHAGFDFLLRAMKGTVATSMLRVPSADPSYIKRVLDSGVECILCPMIESAAAAETLIKACFYPPRGTRGAGGNIRASVFGGNANFAQEVEKELLIAVQIESIAGVEHVEEIAAVRGVDLLVIGPRDLSASIGKLGQFDDPELRRLIARAEAAILASGKYLASVIYPGCTAGEMFDRGYHLLIAGSDIGFLVEGARRILAPR
jgi:4-hydroxy-2-oxoheptanedioate aldolase